jgi:RHS repeat-associated protein
MGNRTAISSTVSGAVTYTYDAADRLLTISDGTTFTWDANGNMTGKGSATYTFNVLDRLTQVVSGTTTVQFTYDGDGVRLSKTVNGMATDYVQDIAAPLPVVLVETTAGQTSQYVYGNDLLTQVDPTGNPSFYHSDGLGSTRALSNLAGQRTDAYGYDVFGLVRLHTGGASQPFTFTGEQVDDELGMVYLRARYYDPQVGRFASRDTHPPLARETQSINRYVYVQNNPAHLTDPSGNAWYDFLDAEKNGLNQFIRDMWNNTGVGDFIVENTPVLNDLVDTAEGMDRYARQRRRSLELITPYMSDADAKAFEEAQQAAMQGLKQGLSSASRALMSAPCTSFNPDCGLTSLAPKPLGDIYDFIRRPFVWLLDKWKDAVVDPIYDIPALYIEYQFRHYHRDPGQPGEVLGMWPVFGGGGRIWGGLPSGGK